MNRKNKTISKGLLRFILLIFHILFWGGILFFGYFIASSPFLPVIVSILVTILLVLFRKKDLPVILLLSVITVGVLFYTVWNGFEEDYCWKYSDAHQKMGEFYTDLTPHEKSFLGSNPTNVSSWLRVHLQCHDSFNFSKVLKEKYLFQ